MMHVTASLCYKSS